ncbi:hypothetical protein [Phytopseudomonas dryadis]|uniref:DUF2946 domain-containing protein n=1 Tax=Phytopseudomonas dryadis TaxID=2487520 RepID=A0ABY1Z491_9GAMM|nr:MULTISPECIES: hypothetical protein [Pseudomonas]TBV02093.1 hypothetical protein DNK34_19870 [Pseudomonas dryadis]TBV14800.1 hypothetical protein DNK41_18970 [Pseudomonas sp. FRB 230]
MASRSLRVLLLCMLVLALPAQGVAAVAMQLSMALAATAASDQAMHGPLAELACAEGIGHPAQAMDHPAPGHAGCGLCAFCVGAVAFDAGLAAPSPLSSSLAGGAWQRHFSGHIGDTPDRPPRRFLV